MVIQKIDRFEARLRIQRLQIQWYKGWLHGDIPKDRLREAGKLIRSRVLKRD